MQKHSPSGMAMMRIDLGITQQELADTLGISRALVAMAERGTRRLPARGQEYLIKLYEIARRIAQPTATRRRVRPSVATVRPPYNRVRFSIRNNKEGKAHIATTRPSLPILTQAELHQAGEKLRDRFKNDSSQYPTSADANRELLVSLDQKAALLQCRLDLLELEKSTVPHRALQIKTRLVYVKEMLKTFRHLYKQYPDKKKRYRRKIALYYVKKLHLHGQLEKFNKPSLLKRKEAIAGVRHQLADLHALQNIIQGRIALWEDTGSAPPVSPSLFNHGENRTIHGGPVCQAVSC